MLDGGRQFLCYMDDASKFVTAYRTFENATAANALLVLSEAVRNHGKPASIMTGGGSPFYSKAGNDASEFEKRMIELDIRRILSGTRHLQTDCKLARLHGEIQRKLSEFEAIMMRKSDSIGLFMKWYNCERPHKSLNWDEREASAQAFKRKMPERDPAAAEQSPASGE